MATEQAMETFHWQGRRIAWRSLGSGPPVVLCHGTPFSSRVWDHYAATLSADHTVYLWDLPGYGRSSKDAEHPVHFGVHADAFSALLDHWGLTRPHVIAHDIGGGVTLRSHLFNASAYASLLLVDVVAIPPSGSPFFQFVGRHHDVLAQLPAYIHRAVLEAYVRNASAGGLSDTDLATLVEPWTTAEGQPAFYRQIADYDESFLEGNLARLDRIAIPVRVVWGTDDPWIPVERATQLRDGIPGATLRLVPEAGHLIQYDAPVALADQIRAWLQEVGTA